MALEAQSAGIGRERRRSLRANAKTTEARNRGGGDGRSSRSAGKKRRRGDSLLGENERSRRRAGRREADVELGSEMTRRGGEIDEGRTSS